MLRRKTWGRGKFFNADSQIVIIAISINYLNPIADQTICCIFAV
nr:MAG TPA: hypothetical protein [Caudoviricetes sp.]